MNYLVEMEVLKRQTVVVVVDEERQLTEEQLHELAVEKSQKNAEAAFVTKEELWVMRSNEILPTDMTSNQVMLLECGYPYEMVMKMKAVDAEAEIDAISRT
jgi:hypothetical protein